MNMNVFSVLHSSLTDDVSRENWEKYGNPDGPQAASFGIALPSWIVEKQNSLWVLAVYMGIFMIALPSLVVCCTLCQGLQGFLSPSFIL